MRRLVLMLAMLPLAVASIQSATAQPKTFDAYAVIAGEIGIARSSCGFDMDTQALLALGRPFAAGTTEQAAFEKFTDVVAGGLKRAAERLQKQGTESFCRDMLAAYGPSGSTHRGLLKAR